MLISPFFHRNKTVTYQSKGARPPNACPTADGCRPMFRAQGTRFCHFRKLSMNLVIRRLQSLARGCNEGDTLFWFHHYWRLLIAVDVLCNMTSHLRQELHTDSCFFRHHLSVMLCWPVLCTFNQCFLHNSVSHDNCCCLLLPNQESEMTACARKWTVC